MRCGLCNDSGKRLDQVIVNICETCNGRGTIEIKPREVPFRFCITTTCSIKSIQLAGPEEMNCPECGNQLWNKDGSQFDQTSVCPTCNGAKIVKQSTFSECGCRTTSLRTVLNRVGMQSLWDDPPRPQAKRPKIQPAPKPKKVAEVAVKSKIKQSRHEPEPDEYKGMSATKAVALDFGYRNPDDFIQIMSERYECHIPIYERTDADLISHLIWGHNT